MASSSRPIHSERRCADGDADSTNIAIYTRLPTEYREPCLQIPAAVAAGDADGTTSTAAMEEVWHFKLSEHAEPKLSRSQARLNRVPELLRVSISHWLQFEQAIGASQRTTCFVARLEIAADTAVDALLRVALTEQQRVGHVDVWGHAADLLRAVAEVIHRRRVR